MHFAGLLSDLPGKVLRAEFDEDQVHPILPGNPANIYDGMHAFPNHHNLKVLERRGNEFLIEWTCEAKQSPLADSKPVFVKGLIRLKSVTVWSKGTLTIAEAREIVGRNSLVDDLGEPQVRKENGETYVEFPYMPSN
jgi:hypothetical protein